MLFYYQGTCKGSCKSYLFVYKSLLCSNILGRDQGVHTLRHDCTLWSNLVLVPPEKLSTVGTIKGLRRHYLMSFILLDFVTFK